MHLSLFSEEISDSNPNRLSKFEAKVFFWFGGEWKGGEKEKKKGRDAEVGKIDVW